MVQPLTEALWLHLVWPVYRRKLGRLFEHGARGRSFAWRTILATTHVCWELGLQQKRHLILIDESESGTQRSDGKLGVAVYDKLTIPMPLVLLLIGHNIQGSSPDPQVYSGFEPTLQSENRINEVEILLCAEVRDQSSSIDTALKEPWNRAYSIPRFMRNIDQSFNIFNFDGSAFCNMHRCLPRGFLPVGLSLPGQSFPWENKVVLSWDWWIMRTGQIFTVNSGRLIMFKETWVLPVPPKSPKQRITRKSQREEVARAGCDR